MHFNSDLVMRWRGPARWRRRTMAVAALAVPLADSRSSTVSVITPAR
ncbi:MAG: hypothetical protein ACLP8X_10950 [Streptosporangiaceae bacterium]